MMKDRQNDDTFRAGDCMVAWGEPGMLLQFAGPGGRRDVAVPAAAAAVLAAALRQALAAHEQSRGVAWSPHDAVLGARCDSRTGYGEGGEALGKHGAELYRLLKNLPLNGYERSFKMQPSRLLSERFLLGIRRDALSAEQLAGIVAGLGLPDACRGPFAAGLPRTVFLHFGHEAGPDGVVRKLYQEFEQDGGQDAARPAPLLYAGYKWDPADGRRHVLTEYRMRAGMDTEDIVERVASLYAGHAGIADVCVDMLRGVAGRCGDGGPLFMEVAEQGNPRVSCDINLYRAQTTLGDLLPYLRKAARVFAIDQHALDDYLRRRGDALLGHLSCGVGRDGAPFLTVYYSLRGAPAAA